MSTPTPTEQMQAEIQQRYHLDLDQMTVYQIIQPSNTMHQFQALVPTSDGALEMLDLGALIQDDTLRIYRSDGEDRWVPLNPY